MRHPRHLSWISAIPGPVIPNPMKTPLPIQEVLETFPAPALPGVAHGLVRRVPGVSVSLDKAEVLALLKPWHEAAVTALGLVYLAWWMILLGVVVLMAGVTGLLFEYYRGEFVRG